jgi:UDP-N-acetylmuramate dehydrogenase
MIDKISIAGMFKKYKTDRASFAGEILTDEPMSRHTTFRVGGPADFLLRPAASDFDRALPALLREAEQNGVPIFVMGGGANLLVSDAGIRGIVLQMTGEKIVSSAESAQSVVNLSSGLRVDTAVEWAAGMGFSGLEAFAGMPGTVGGALYMNARCYGREMADLAPEVTILDENWEKKSVPFVKNDWAYKKSPFQGRKCVI